MVGGLVPGNPPNLRILTSVQEFHNAYAETIDTFKNIGGSNYRLLLIENPSPNSFGFVPVAHSDPAQYNRHSQISVWNAGKQIGSRNGVLGEVVNHFSRSANLPTASPVTSIDRGGVHRSGSHRTNWRTAGIPTVWRSRQGIQIGLHDLPASRKPITMLSKYEFILQKTLWWIGIEWWWASVDSDCMGMFRHVCRLVCPSLGWTDSMGSLHQHSRTLSQRSL